MTPEEHLKDEIQPDGHLYSLGWYLYWGIGEKDAVLDGKFTSQDLRAIADYMDKMNEQA